MNNNLDTTTNIKLPEGIDYSLYDSESGMATKRWGPSFWNSLFVSIMGRYPFKIDTSNEEHLLLQSEFKHLLTSLSNIMPCVFCRNSFKNFLKELPIEPFLIGRIELMYWLYLMKDKVNKKLICQENLCYNDEKKRLKSLYYNKQISKEEYYQKIKEFKEEAFTTIPTPPFKEVLDKYEAIRAVCSQKSLSCVLPKKENQ
jgi:hypothetical protein